MSETKFTPGPWMVEHNSWSESSVYAGGRSIAVFYIDSNADEETQDEYETEKDANATLASSAPDLFNACEAAWNCIGELPPTQARVEVAQMLCAAIAKARGES